MDNLLCLTLEAHNAERNHHRSYTISIGQDLLSMWTVSVRHGRVGRFGRERRFACEDVDAVQQLIRRHLSRRVSAPKRIGCAYKLESIESGDDLRIADWLPADTLRQFFREQLDAASHPLHRG